MANQYPMSYNFPGPFNLKGTAGQNYILQADDAGNLYVVESGDGNVDSVAAGTGMTVSPTTGNVVVTLTTPVSVAHGGTGAANLNALATSGANSNITSLTGLTTALSTSQGGTGSKLFSFGTATFMSAGSVAVADTSVTSSSIIVVTEVTATPLAEEFSVVPNATVGFTIYSTNAASTAVVNYIRVA